MMEGRFIPIRHGHADDPALPIRYTLAAGTFAACSPPSSAGVDLAEPCRCGHDRGDHLDAVPHACDGTPHGDGARTLIDVCVCRGFEPARTTRAMREAMAVPCACRHTRADHSDDSPHECREDECPCRSFTPAEPIHERG